MKQKSLSFGDYSVMTEAEMPKPRPYQELGIDEMRKLVARGLTRLLLTCPTGGGKTVVASAIIHAARKLGMKIIFIAHRKELINQTVLQLARWAITNIGIIRGTDKRTNPDAPVQVASIQTLSRREIAEDAFDIAFIDECHRAMSASYKVIFDLLPRALHIGLTATPFRTDNQGLGEYYEALITCARPSQLVADGFIVEPKAFSAPVLPDLTSVAFSLGTNDWHNGQLEEAVSKPRLVGSIIEEWKERNCNPVRRTVGFAVNIEHSMLITSKFREAGVRAAHIDGTTKDRDKILYALETGEIDVIFNCDVLAEGWDQPSVKCAILARPTESAIVHLQQCGRILRPYGDVSALILDHAGNCQRHGLPHWDREFSLTVGITKKSTDPVIRVCPMCYAMCKSTDGHCSECGFIFPIQARKPIEHEEEVKLVEVQLRPPPLTKADVERAYFLKSIHSCRNQGLKPGSASYRFKEKFGRWPPYGWSAQAKRMYSEDKGWQDAQRQREKNRDYWKGPKDEPQSVHETHRSAEDSQRQQADSGGWEEEPDDNIPF